MDNLDSAHFRITEKVIVPVAEDQNIEGSGLKVFELVQLGSITVFRRTGEEESQEREYCQSSHHSFSLLFLAKVRRGSGMSKEKYYRNECLLGWMSC
jgi:hypothetical protein